MTMQCMDRALLESYLAEGLSLAEIGRRESRHASTVGYWVREHGLRATNRARHVPRGGLSREVLQALVAEGLSIQQISAEVRRSKTTVRHWLREYGLATHRPRSHGVVSGERHRLELRCPRHGLTTFVCRSEGGYRCTRCRAEAVSKRRRGVKNILVEEAGGCCRICGYDRCSAALEFHHVVPAEKRFSLSHRGVARSLEAARAEASKCVLLCSNCHAEVEAGMVALA